MSTQGKWVLHPGCVAVALLAASISQVSPLFAQQPTSSPQAMTIIGGSPSGRYIGIADYFADTYQDKIRQETRTGTFRMLALSGEGSIQNIADLNTLEFVTAAITQTDALDILGDASLQRQLLLDNERFNTACISRYESVEFKPIREVIRFGPEFIHLVGRRAPDSSGERLLSIQDLHRKKVSIGPECSGHALTALRLFKAYNIEPEIVFESIADSFVGIVDGRLDAVFFVIAPPAPQLVALPNYFQSFNLKLLEIPANDIISESESYKFVELSCDRDSNYFSLLNDVYSNRWCGQDSESAIQFSTSVSTVAVSTSLIVLEEAADSETKAVFEFSRWVREHVTSDQFKKKRETSDDLRTLLSNPQVPDNEFWDLN